MYAATVTPSQDVEMTFRCKAFSGEGVRLHRVRIETLGDILVWDSIAGHYTSCHSIAKSTQAKIRKAAVNFWAHNHFYGK